MTKGCCPIMPPSTSISIPIICRIIIPSHSLQLSPTTWMSPLKRHPSWDWGFSHSYTTSIFVSLASIPKRPSKTSNSTLTSPYTLSLNWARCPLHPLQQMPSQPKPDLLLELRLPPRHHDGEATAWLTEALSASGTRETWKSQLGGRAKDTRRRIYWN